MSHISSSRRAPRLVGLVSVLAVSGALLGACATGATLDGSGGSGGVSTTPSSSSGKSVTHASANVTSSGEGGASSTTGPGPGPGPGVTTTGPGSTTMASSAVSTTGSGMSPPGTLFFSEYVEGSSNNKALEIVNAGPTPVSLGGCQIDRYMNGATTPASPIILDNVMLASGQTFVICHTSFSMLTLCDQVSGSVQHTGNDVVGLSCNGTTKDVFGKIGDSVVWGTAPTISMDATLRRKCTVLVGDTNGNDAFDPATEWNGFPIDTFSDLGQYICP